MCSPKEIIDTYFILLCLLWIRVDVYAYACVCVTVCIVAFVSSDKKKKKRSNEDKSCTQPMGMENSVSVCGSITCRVFIAVTYNKNVIMHAPLYLSDSLALLNVLSYFF